MMCNLLLVDDHALIRAGVRALIADIPGYAVIGEASDGAQVLDLVRQLRPDIILLDISMKDTNGLDALARANVPANENQARSIRLTLHATR
jgi:DNA-binding NarL/FixJ family response regulator